MQASAVSQHNSHTFFPRRTRRGFGASAPGSTLITALAFTVIIALALAGMGTLTVSHYNLAQIQAASSEALDLSEAGINWELYKLTNNGIASADSGGTVYSASDKIATGLPGTFTVACATLDGFRAHRKYDAVYYYLHGIYSNCHRAAGQAHGSY